jgi:hypothetical protein
MAVLIDSYPSSNYNGVANERDHHPSDSTYSSAFGQSFRPSVNCTLDSVEFYLAKINSPTGYSWAALFAHSGTFGGGGYQSGGAWDYLAISDPIDVSTFTTSPTFSIETYTFTGENRIQLVSGTVYCITYINPSSGTITSAWHPVIAVDTSAPTHNGNANRYNNGSWGAYTIDGIFYVYGEIGTTPGVIQIAGTGKMETNQHKIIVGNTFAAPSLDVVLENNIRSIWFETTEPGYLESVSGYINIGTGYASGIAIALYEYDDYSSTYAGNIIASSQFVPVTEGNGTHWITRTFNPEPYLSGNTRYYISIVAESGDGSCRLRYVDTSPSTCTYDSYAGWPTWPDPLGDAQTTLHYSIYGIYRTKSREMSICQI